MANVAALPGPNAGGMTSQVWENIFKTGKIRPHINISFQIIAIARFIIMRRKPTQYSKGQHLNAGTLADPLLKRALCGESIVCKVARLKEGLREKATHNGLLIVVQLPPVVLLSLPRVNQHCKQGEDCVSNKVYKIRHPGPS
jgi:hypothetical protein